MVIEFFELFRWYPQFSMYRTAYHMLVELCGIFRIELEFCDEASMSSGSRRGIPLLGNLLRIYPF